MSDAHGWVLTAKVLCVMKKILMTSLRRAHPEDPEVVICDTGRGMRMCGGGLPTRAMGDCTHQLPDPVLEE